jgi:hypothetical protein
MRAALALFQSAMYFFAKTVALGTQPLRRAKMGAQGRRGGRPWAGQDGHRPVLGVTMPLQASLRTTAFPWRRGWA